MLSKTPIQKKETLEARRRGSRGGGPQNAKKDEGKDDVVQWNIKP